MPGCERPADLHERQARHRGKNCTLVSKEVQVVPSQAPAASSSSRSSAANADRAENRRKILESELQNEQQLLPTPQQKLTEQERHTLGRRAQLRTGAGALEALQEAVDLHTKNIEAAPRRARSAR